MSHYEEWKASKTVVSNRKVCFHMIFRALLKTLLLKKHPNLSQRKPSNSSLPSDQVHSSPSLSWIKHVPTTVSYTSKIILKLYFVCYRQQRGFS